MTTPSGVARRAALTEQQIETLRQALIEAREAQTAHLDEDVLEALSDSETTVERELADASLERTREAVAEIEQALARMEAGTYGLCETCGTDIPYERLEVLPETRQCVACTARRGGFMR